MFQPISHRCSCLLLAEAGPESHLFYLSRSSKLERHQKAWGSEKAQNREKCASTFVVPCSLKWNNVVLNSLF